MGHRNKRIRHRGTLVRRRNQVLVGYGNSKYDCAFYQRISSLAPEDMQLSQ